MTNKEIKVILIECLEEIQSLGGRPPAPIGDDTVPIGDLPEFDSLNAIEVLVALEQRLKVANLNEDLFLTEDGNRPVSVMVIVRRLGEAMEGVAHE